MAAWSEFHTDPRKSYYLFLRQGYERPARVAYAQVKRIDIMIAELQQPPSHPAPLKGCSDWLLAGASKVGKRLRDQAAAVRSMLSARAHRPL
jgi:hypothetical protein